MTIRDALDKAALSVRAVKEMTLARDESLDMFVEPWRGATPVAVVAFTSDRELLARVTDVCASGLSADTISISMDMYQSTVMTNPRTGRPWAPGELSDAATNHGALESGMVTEAIVSAAYNRSGDSGHRVQPYTVTSHGVEWLPSDCVPDAGEVSGALEEMMQVVMDRASIDQTMAREGLGIANERDRAVVDFQVVRKVDRIVKGTGHIMLHARRGTSRFRYLEHRMSGRLIVSD